MKKQLGIALFSLFLAGCNGSLVKQDIVKQLIKAPEVRDISLNSFSAQDQRVSFDIDLYNPNLFSLPVSGVSGDFQLNSMPVGSVAAQFEEHLAAQSSQTVTLPIKLNTDALGAAIRKALMTGRAAYTFNGGVSSSVAEVPVSKTGELSIADLTKMFLN